MTVRIYTVYHGTDIPHFSRGIYTSFDAGRTDGDNIARKLTFEFLRAHYWVWKNPYRPEFEYVGFQHYRRWLGLSHLQFKDNGLTCVDDPDTFRSFSRNARFVPDELLDYDWIVARPWKFDRPIGEEYARCHIKEHWDVMLDEEPEFKTLAANEHRYNVCTTFVAKRNEFEKFMAFWWDLIQRIQARIDIPPSGYQSRAIGFLSERIFSLWLKREKLRRILHVAEVPLIMDLSQKIPDSWEMAA